MVSKWTKFIAFSILTVFVIAVTVALIFHFGYLSARGHPVVVTKLGLISGLRATDGDYSMFMGIPFARVNDTNPFGRALPYPPFDGVFHAHDDSLHCPQLELYNNTLVGSLDCLQLNIHVPDAASATNLLPVLVYIYGSRYEIGFPGRHVYGPKFLVKHDIIVVTPNYRLGPYGFFCLNNPDVSGNQGIKDQVMALRWIKSNIQAFGGDSNKITIAGESSSGQDVNFHIMYGEEGLFNNAIIGAGAFLKSVQVTPPDDTYPLAIAKDLGCNTSDLSEALSFLSKQDTNLVIASSQNLNLKYLPCVERKFDNVENEIFIHEYPIKTKINNIETVSVIISQSIQEMLSRFIHEDFDGAKHQNIFRDRITKHLNIDQDKLEGVVDYVRRFYIGDKNVSESVKEQIIDFCSDLYQNYPLQKKIQQFLKNNAKKIYFSIFSYQGRRNYIKLEDNADLDTPGAGHVDEIGYLFDVWQIGELVTPRDQLIIDRMTTLWANFVKYSDPTPETTGLLPVKWEPVTDDSMPYLNIDVNLTLGREPFRERMKFWDAFFEMNQTVRKQN